LIRIVGGSVGGRLLATPKGMNTRPTSDRAREALFSSVEAARSLAGAQVLDLYAGSGALGLEALSRGAAAVVLVEADRKVCAVLRANVAALGLPGAQVVTARVAEALAQPAAEAFDLLFADPPYAVPAAEVAAALTAAAANGWLAPEALVVLERAGRDPDFQWPCGFVALRERRYGEATLWFGRFTGDPAGQLGTPPSGEDGEGPHFPRA
jgi:16S rRNA (guanine966-N2)-methyltransferase